MLGSHLVTLSLLAQCFSWVLHFVNSDVCICGKHVAHSRSFKFASVGMFVLTLYIILMSVRKSNKYTLYLELCDVFLFSFLPHDFHFSSLTYNSYLKLLLEAYSRHHISTPVNAWICIWCDSLVIPLHVSNSLYFIQGKRTLPYCTCHTWYFTLQVLETLGLHFYLHTCGVNVIDGMNTACD